MRIVCRVCVRVDVEREKDCTSKLKRWIKEDIFRPHLFRILIRILRIHWSDGTGEKIKMSGIRSNLGKHLTSGNHSDPTATYSVSSAAVGPRAGRSGDGRSRGCRCPSPPSWRRPGGKAVATEATSALSSHRMTIPLANTETQPKVSLFKKRSARDSGVHFSCLNPRVRLAPSFSRCVHPSFE